MCEKLYEKISPNAYIQEVIITGYAGSDLSDIVSESFNWFMHQTKVRKCSVVHLNGVAVVFERKGDDI